MAFSGHAILGGVASCSYVHQPVERPVCSMPTSASGHVTGSGVAQNRLSRSKAAPFTQHKVQRRSTILLRAEGGWNPPTVADTKAKFYNKYKKPLPAVYNTVIQELLVQQHILRYNKNYSYDVIFALGLVSVFDQVLDGVSENAEAIFAAYIGALDEDPSSYRSDAEKLASWAKGLSGPTDIKPDAEGDEVQKQLADIASRAKEDKFLYTKFFAIGLFRLLELTGAKDPKALGNLVKAMNVRQESVNRDLMTYKGVLSKLSAAKELMREFIEREKKKQAERDAEKKAKADSQTPTPAVAADAEKANA